MKMKADAFKAAADKLFLRKIYSDGDVYTIEKVVYANGRWFDKTACESITNRIFIDDFFEYDSIDELRECGVLIAEIWVSRLKAEYSDKSFMVFLTLNEGDSEFPFVSSTLRFCLKRDDEPPLTDEQTDGKTFFVWTT